MSAVVAAVPDPTVVGPVVVCRVVISGGLSYTTHRMTEDEANKVRDEMRQAVAAAHHAALYKMPGGTGPLISFPAVHHESVDIRADRITVIEVMRCDTYGRTS